MAEYFTNNMHVAELEANVIVQHTIPACSYLHNVTSTKGFSKAYIYINYSFRPTYIFRILNIVKFIEILHFSANQE